MISIGCLSWGIIGKQNKSTCRSSMLKWDTPTSISEIPEGWFSNKSGQIFYSIHQKLRYYFQQKFVFYIWSLIFYWFIHTQSFSTLTIPVFMHSIDIPTDISMHHHLLLNVLSSGLIIGCMTVSQQHNYGRQPSSIDNCPGYDIKLIPCCPDYVVKLTNGMILWVWLQFVLPWLIFFVWLYPNRPAV